jgi:hypothetical protein
MKAINVASLVEISDLSSLDHATAIPERALHTANLCVRLLLSKDSVVIRRLIMTAVCITSHILSAPFFTCVVATGPPDQHLRLT